MNTEQKVIVIKPRNKGGSRYLSPDYFKWFEEWNLKLKRTKKHIKLWGIR
jgi:hypothetical protein